MSEMEPVAWAWRNNAAEQFVVSLDEPEICWEKQPLVTLSSAQAEIKAKDERIAGLEAANKKMRGHLDALALNDAGYQSIVKFEARAEAAEAQLAAAREVIQRMEWASEQLAATRTMKVYDAMLEAGQADALLEMDNARRAARAWMENSKEGQQ